MNYYQINRLNSDDANHFNALLMGALLSPNFEISIVLDEVNTTSELTIYRSAITFGLDFSLSNYFVGSNLHDLIGLQPLRAGVLQVLKDSRLTGTKELSFKPYPVKGYKVAFLQKIEGSNFQEIAVDMEADFISFPIVNTKESGQFMFVIGTVNASQTETYKPFQNAAAKGVKIIKYFSESDIRNTISQNSCGNVKPFLSANVARKNL